MRDAIRCDAVRELRRVAPRPVPRRTPPTRIGRAAGILPASEQPLRRVPRGDLGR